MALLGVLGVLLSGCSATQAKDGEPPDIVLKRITTAAQTLAPANALLPDASERELISLAHDTLLAECVAKQGLNLALAGDEPMTWVTTLTAPYGGGNTFFPVDPERMERFGYHDPLDQQAAQANVAWQGEFTPIDAVRSCDDEISEQLGGPPPFDLTRLISEAGQKAGSDPRRAWVACMADKGYAYTREGGPWAEFALDTSRSTATPEEIAVATADAACQASARNTDTFFALLVAYQQKALAQHSEQVAAYQVYLRQLLTRATQIVAEHPVPQNRRANVEAP